MKVTKQQVSDFLKALGVPANLNGYVYLRHAVLLAVQQPDMLKSLTKVLYPAVAKECNTTWTRVERSMRHAIEHCFTHGDRLLCEKLFRNGYSAQKGKPTNKQFLATVVDFMMLRGDLK